MKTKLLFLSILFALLFTLFSYSVAKEKWQQIDFDTTVKVQDNISDHISPERGQKIDRIFSYFSVIGSVEITLGLCLILAAIALITGKWLVILGWLMIIPASMAEVFGKLMVFHPGPPVLFHKTLMPTNLPMFYVHTNFSYPSGHMTRTIFIITIFALIIFFSSKNMLFKSVSIGSLFLFALIMGLTRVYLGEHWLSDVIGGGLLGLAVGFLAAVLILRPKKG